MKRNEARANNSGTGGGEVEKTKYLHGMDDWMANYISLFH